MGTQGKKTRMDGQEKRKPGPKSGLKTAHKSTYKPKGKGKNHSLSIGEKLNILEAMQKNNWTQGEAAHAFSKKLGVHVDQGSISQWLPKKQGWLEEIEK